MTDNVMRAKMRLISEKVWADSAASGAKVYSFSAQYSQSPEDNSYSKYTPSASFEMTIDNPAVQAKLKLGETYYVDFTPATFPNVDKVAEYIAKTSGLFEASTIDANLIVTKDNPLETPLASEAANLISQEERVVREGTGLGALRDSVETSGSHTVTPNPNLPAKSYWTKPDPLDIARGRG